MSYISQSLDDYKTRFSDLKNHILYSLGYPVVRVELTEEHLLIAIIDAITRFYDRAAMDVNCEIVSVGANSTVDIPSTIKPSMIEEVIYEIEVLDSYARGIFVGASEDTFGKVAVPYPSWNSILDNFDMVGYYMFLQRLEDFKELVGIDRHWDITNGKIYLYPAEASYTKVGIIYKQLRSDNSLETAPWIKDWATAKAKHILGTIRSKMSGFQTAGGNISADGEALKAEAKEEMSALSEQLMLMQKPLPILQF